MTTLHSIRIIAALTAASLSTLAAAPALAQSSAGHARPGEEKITPLQQQLLKDVPGKQALMVTVDYAPGQESTPHVHSGSVFAYVLEGEVVSQLAAAARLNIAPASRGTSRPKYRTLSPEMPAPPNLPDCWCG